MRLHCVRSVCVHIRRVTLLVAVAAGLSAAPLPADSPVPAFPGAEGFGRLATGGRGGDVYHVTTLDDAGPGSLREGVATATGPRTIVFDVGGEIRLQSPLLIDRSFLTIAGQTAPGDGITIRDRSVQIRNATDVVLRYLRMRLGDDRPADVGGADDALVTDDVRRIIIDHCSLSWAIDGTHDLRRGGDFTLQWCIISEALNHSLHGKGAHAMAASYRDLTGPITLHHNLIASCRDRHPSLGSAREPPRHVVDFRNNLVYHWTTPGTTNFCDHFINCINNVWRPGPTSEPAQLPIAMKGTLPDMAKGHMAGNVFEGREDLTADNYAALDFHRWLGPGRNYRYSGSVSDWRSDEPADLGAALPLTHEAAEAAELVLAHAGASFRRDAVDERVIGDVRNRTGMLIDSPRQVGGYPVLQSAPAPADSDQDGMPDDWETRHGLDPLGPEDRNADPDHDGYTHLEAYLNGLVTSAPPPPPEAETVAKPTFEEYLRSSAVPREVIDRFLKGPSWARHDPELGYVLGNELPTDGIDHSATISTVRPDGARTSFVYADKPCRINTYGDSFTQCHQVSDGETWQEYLAGHLGEPVRNFGMGGYGVYQAYRRLVREEQTAHGAEYLIFYIWGGDHIRSLLRCRHAITYPQWDHQGGRMFHNNFWPNLEMDPATGQFTENENPLPTPESLYRMTDPQWMVEHLQDDLALQLHAFKLGYTRDVDRRSIDRLAAQLDFAIDWRQEADLPGQAGRLLDRYSLRATRHVLGKVRDFARRHGKKLLVVVFDPYRAMAEMHRGEARYDQEIVDFLTHEGYDFFDMNEVHLRDFQRYNLSFDDYLAEYFIGHYNPRGNHFFAYAIKDKVVAWLDPQPLPYRRPDAESIDFRRYLRD